MRKIRSRTLKTMFLSARARFQFVFLTIIVGCFMLFGINHVGAVDIETPIHSKALTVYKVPAPNTGKTATIIKTKKPTIKTSPTQTAISPTKPQKNKNTAAAGEKTKKNTETTPGKTAKTLSKTRNQKQADAKNKKTKTAKQVVYKRSGICSDLDKLARRYKLPPLFFARLIWQESGFNPYAVSPVGAEGIAQFMPETARVWGLDDPFEPGQAMLKSAQYLSWLRRKLGNLGLAAAGYNAGSERVRGWVNGKRTMPLETRNYVYSITGHTVEEWAHDNIKFVGIKVRGRMPSTACKQLSIALRGERIKLLKTSFSRKGKIATGYSPRHNRAWRTGKPSRRAKRRLPRMPWGVQLAGSFSRGIAMKQFRAIKRKYARIIGSKRIVFKSSRQSGRVVVYFIASGSAPKTVVPPPLYASACVLLAAIAWS